ncbi:MAG: hypothetical protein H6557_26730 [Lewinellaceae bacterium]|nr:hypothetical protein [Phaeodactylibacter sp.]MCB9040236.1 hypothetical protein [Lewinellaceae bacterium]
MIQKVIGQSLGAKLLQQGAAVYAQPAAFSRNRIEAHQAFFDYLAGQAPLRFRNFPQAIFIIILKNRVKVWQVGCVNFRHPIAIPVRDKAGFDLVFNCTAHDLKLGSFHATYRPGTGSRKDIQQPL